jgi:hypothetical protein
MALVSRNLGPLLTGRRRMPEAEFPTGYVYGKISVHLAIFFIFSQFSRYFYLVLTKKLDFF